MRHAHVSPAVAKRHADLVAQIRAHVRNYLHARMPHFDKPAEGQTEAEVAAAVEGAREWIDAAICGLGLELGEAYAVAVQCYDLPSSAVMESLQANVLGPAGIHVVATRLRLPAPGEQPH